MTIIRAHGYIFGGYTDYSWISYYYYGYSGRYRYSSKAFIFSLKNYFGYGYFKKDITGYHVSYATYSHRYYGPTFGSGFDIHVANYANSNYNSYFNSRSYTGKYSNNNVWTGSNTFCANEVEVYRELTS